tara:strand:- start:116 stop:262 length:147 start_codon:yes stop_codon:yes gene_type:complete
MDWLYACLIITNTSKTGCLYEGISRKIGSKNPIFSLKRPILYFISEEN